ncbi:MAG: glycine cleavage system protein GcvH [bacterium]
MLIPDHLRYSKDHEWASVEDGRVLVGITDFAQQQLGDIVYVELPGPGEKLKAGQSFGVVESVKAVSDLLAPVSGEVLEVNGELAEHPEWVNQDPYGKGWMIAVQMDNPSELEGLLDAKGYGAFIAEEA